MTFIISFDQTNYFLAFLVFFPGMRINGRASPRLACSYCCIYYEYARRSERPSVRASEYHRFERARRFSRARANFFFFAVGFRDARTLGSSSVLFV